MKFGNNANLQQNELQNAVIQNLPSAPSSPKVGQIYFDTTLSIERSWDGTNWIGRSTPLTDAEIKTAYENNADTNEFNDAEKVKLAAIEAGATADQTGTEIKSLYEAEANTNAFTDAEKTKLAGLESSKFLGTYLNLAALNTAHPSPAEGSYADVDGGATNDVQRYIWDNDDSKFVAQSGEVAGITAAEVKTLYESNADTNALTDALLALLQSAPQKADVDFVTDGVALTYPLTHNLGTSAVVVTIYDDDAGEVVLVDVEVTSDNAINVIFGNVESAPNGGNWKAVIIG